MIPTASAAHPWHARMQPQRIAATSTVITLHAVAFGLLLIPATGLLRSQAPAQPRTQVHWAGPEIATPPPPPPILPAKPMAPSPSVPLPLSIPVLVDHVDAAEVTRVAAALDATDFAPVDTVAMGATDNPGIAVASDAGGVLRMLVAPPPAYPASALRDRASGEVVLRVLVGSDGRALQVEIERSSGRRDLDQAARQQVLRRWRFTTPVVDGQPGQAWGRVPIAFTFEH